jgi:hypothetical protein
MNNQQNNFKFNLIQKTENNGTEIIFTIIDSKHDIIEKIKDNQYRRYNFKYNIESLNKISNESNFSFLNVNI